MEKKYKFLSPLIEDDAKMITVDASDRNAARNEVNRASRQNPSQIKRKERADADLEKAEAQSEGNPQVKGLKMRRANLMKQLSQINDQISRANKSA